MQTIKETKEQVHTHSHVNEHDKGESAAVVGVSVCTAFVSLKMSDLKKFTAYQEAIVPPTGFTCVCKKFTHNYKYIHTYKQTILTSETT